MFVRTRHVHQIRLIMANTRTLFEQGQKWFSDLWIRMYCHLLYLTSKLPRDTQDRMAVLQRKITAKKSNTAKYWTNFDECQDAAWRCTHFLKQSCVPTMYPLSATLSTGQKPLTEIHFQYTFMRADPGKIPKMQRFQWATHCSPWQVPAMVGNSNMLKLSNNTTRILSYVLVYIMWFGRLCFFL